MNIKKILTIPAILLLGGLSACVEFSQPICDLGTLQDVPGLPEAKFTNLYFDNEVVQDDGAETLHMGTGLYGDGEEVTTRTCKIGNRLFAESKNDKGNYEIAQLEMSNGRSRMTPIMISKSKLEELNFKYHLEWRAMGLSAKAASLLGNNQNTFAGEDDYVVVIDSLTAESAQRLESDLVEGSIIVQALPNAIGQ